MKSKRHTEHYSRSTQNSSRCSSSVHWRIITRLICTKNTHCKLKRFTLSWITNQQSDKVLMCLVFLWKKCLLCPLLVGKREERGVFLQTAVCFICQEMAEQYKPLSTSTSHLLLSRYISSSPHWQSAPVFNFHRSSLSFFFGKTVIKYWHKGKIHPLILNT